MRHYNTIIMGGGMAGLGCARTLAENDMNDFVVLTKDVGGRAPRSDNKATLATFYARSDYTNVQPYLSLGRRATPWKGCLITDTGKVWRAIPILIRHPVEAFRFMQLILKYDKHYQRFMKKCTTLSQAEALNEDPFLLNLYTQPAWDCVKEWNIRHIGEIMIRTLVRTTGLIDMDAANGFIMCWIWVIAIRRTYECTIDIEKLISPFSKRIITDTVENIIYENDTWILKTKTGHTYSADTLVAATPLDVSCALLDRKMEPRFPVVASMQHIRGTPKKQYCVTRYNVLDPSDTNAISLVDCDDGTYLLISNKEKPDPSQYFTHYTIIDYCFWNPAGFIGLQPIPSCIDKHLYMIGDFNVLSMEAAFVSGTYAANRVLMQSK